MNNKGVGAVFCLIAALLMAAKYLAAAIFMSGVVSWSGELFRSGLEHVGPPLSIAAGIAWSWASPSLSGGSFRT